MPHPNQDNYLAIDVTDSLLEDSSHPINIFLQTELEKLQCSNESFSNKSELIKSMASIVTSGFGAAVYYYISKTANPEIMKHLASDSSAVDVWLT